MINQFKPLLKELVEVTGYVAERMMVREIYMDALYGSLVPQIEAEKEPKAFKMMWDSKLKSRDAFLMILEFLPHTKKELSTILAMVKPAAGRLFYCGYVYPSA